MKHLIIFIISFLYTISVYSNNNTTYYTVTGEYTFYSEKGHSLSTCENYALEGARINAINNQFGSNISQNILQHDTESNTYYSSFNNTELKGEWISDIETPKFSYTLSNDGCYIVTCKVKGNIREISNTNNIDIDVLLLKNGTSISNADTNFKNNDNLYMYVKTPIDGYIAIFVIGDQHQVYRILPYSRSHIQEIKINHDTPYIFFSEKCDNNLYGQVDELKLTVNNDVSIDYNCAYVIFSPNKFIKPTDNKQSIDIVPELTYEKFQKWLTKNCTRDPNMVIKKIHFSVSN